MANERTFTNDKGVIGEAGEYFPWKKDEGGGGGAVSSVNGKTGAVVLTAADLDDSFKDALLDCFANVAWVTEDGQQYYDALESALYPLDGTPIYTKTRSDCVIGGLDIHPSNADYINTGSTKRCSCKSLDMYISGNHTYRIVATSDDSTVKMGIQLYNQTAVDAIEANQDFAIQDVQSFGWEESLDATKTIDATYHNAAIKLLRLTFKKANDSAFTSVPISKIEVYDITDVVTP